MRKSGYPIRRTETAFCSAEMEAEIQRGEVYGELIHSVVRSGSEARLKVTGSSMLPVIWPGDEITVRNCEYAELQSGEIVLYRRDGGLTAHRIERIAQDYLVTRGDSLPSSDPPVFAGAIVGRVVSILRNGNDARLEASPGSRIVSMFLCRSDLSRRLALRLFRLSHRYGRLRRRSGEMDRAAAETVSDSDVRKVSSQTGDAQRVAVPVASSGEPEFNLLLTIARAELPANQRSRLQELLAQTLDWGHLLAMAELHGLEPLLLRHLRLFASQAVPDQVMQVLRENCRVIAVRNFLLSSKLREVSAQLTSLAIEHIAYKGPLLAEIYGDSGVLRAYRDLDLLVPQKRLEALRDALRDAGFVDRYGLTEAQQAASFRAGFEHSFVSSEGIDLDVHWRVVQEFKARALDMDGIWERRMTARLLDRDVPALSAEDLLVVLCLHAGHHGWTQLSHMADLAQVFHVHGKFDWKIVDSHLGDSNTRRIVCISLHLLQKHWGVDISPEISRLISADPHVEQLAHRIETEVWPSREPALTTSSLRWLLQRSAGEDWRDRARLLAGSIFVPSIEDFALFRLSSRLSYLYPGLRVMRLAWNRVSPG